MHNLKISLDHDFPSSSTGISIPHGIFDIKRNEAYVTIGTSKDTSEFNCDCIRLWWNDYGKKYYPNTTKILVLSDGGGSNSSRHSIFKQELQDLSNETRMTIKMAYSPPYTSKYNPIEHKVFCHITRAYQGVIFKNIEIVNELIGRSKTKTGLKVYSRILTTIYETGKKGRDDFKEKMTIKFDDYLGKWNYVAVLDCAL